MSRFLFRNPSQPVEEVLADLITQYYRTDHYLPPMIFVPFLFEDRLLLEEILSEQKGEKVGWRFPAARPGIGWNGENARGAKGKRPIRFFGVIASASEGSASLAGRSVRA
jgi:hypothetical protein